MLKLNYKLNWKSILIVSKICFIQFWLIQCANEFFSDAYLTDWKFCKNILNELQFVILIMLSAKAISLNWDLNFTLN